MKIHNKKPERILFVCLANINRSPKAEEVFREMLREAGYKVKNPCQTPSQEDYDFEVFSAGTNANEEANQLEREIAHSADIIFALDEEVLCKLMDKFGVPYSKIKNLDIPDLYHRQDPALRILLEQRLRKYIPLNLK
jgi:predicted protein tyrosine phosphatase